MRFGKKSRRDIQTEAADPAGNTVPPWLLLHPIDLRFASFHFALVSQKSAPRPLASISFVDSCEYCNRFINAFTRRWKLAEVTGAGGGGKSPGRERCQDGFVRPQLGTTWSTDPRQCWSTRHQRWQSTARERGERESEVAVIHAHILQHQEHFHQQLTEIDLNIRFPKTSSMNI